MAIRRALTASQTDTAHDPGSSVAVGTSSTLVAGYNRQRIELTVVNDSDATIYLSLGGEAEVGKGIRLNAHGGAYLTTAFLGEVTAVATEADSNLTMAQLVRAD